MSIQLRQHAEALLGKSARVLMGERVDDGALRIAEMSTMGVPEVLDRPSPRHGTQRRRSWGWTAVMWLASMRTEGDQRKGAVATSITGLHHPLSPLTAQVIAPLDCRDDRLSHVLPHVRKPT